MDHHHAGLKYVACLLEFHCFFLFRSPLFFLFGLSFIFPFGISFDLYSFFFIGFFFGRLPWLFFLRFLWSVVGVSFSFPFGVPLICLWGFHWIFLWASHVASPVDFHGPFLWSFHFCTSSSLSGNFIGKTSCTLSWELFIGIKIYALLTFRGVEVVFIHCSSHNWSCCIL